MRFKALTVLFAPMFTALALAAVIPTAEAKTATPPYPHYVALGDSYTAGPFIPQQLPGPLGCFRSSADYPAFLAAYLQVKTFTDVSCSAARSEHMFTPQTGSLPGAPVQNTNKPQLDALKKDTNLVTLGIGGNDFGLFGEMIDQCADLAKDDPDGAPCKEHFTVNGVDTKIRDAKRIQANIENVLRNIKARSPKARVVVVGYLRILPETGTCTDVPFAKGDYAWGMKVHRQLNASLKAAAVKYRATYVDMFPVSRGHDVCAGDAAWVNGATVKPHEAMNYHPYRIGMQNIAAQTFRTLTGKTAPVALPESQLLNVQHLSEILLTTG